MDNKQWYEVFIDNGKEGTMTVNICETLKEAKLLKKSLEIYGNKNIHIDQWEDIDNPKSIKSIV